AEGAANRDSLSSLLGVQPEQALVCYRGVYAHLDQR
ncbi:hypothetical protein KIPB_014218, partial [Kipferlia bialata]